MGDWALGQGFTKNAWYPTFVNGTGPYYVTATSSASTNTKGSWTEITSATDFESVMIVIHYINTGGTTARSILLDIGIGVASSEVVLIENITQSQNLNYLEINGTNFAFPISIPKGSRLSCRLQSTVGSTTCKIGLSTYVGNFASSSLSRVTTYGAVTASSTGTTVDAGATANTKGAWAELSASTDYNAKGFILSVNFGIGGIRADSDFLLDIGVGAASSEVVLFENFHFRGNSSNDSVSPQGTHFIGVAIPKGSRLVVRTASTDTDSSDRLLYVVCHMVS